MKHFKAFLTTSILTLVLIAAVGCNNNSDSINSNTNASISPSDHEISVLVPNSDKGWTGAVLKYAQTEAETILGSYTAQVYAANSAQEMNQQIDQLLDATDKPAGIVVLPFDETLEPAIQNVANSGIPLVMFDRIFDNQNIQAKVVTNVKGDNQGIGKAIAQRFVSKGLKPGDKIFVIINDISSIGQMRNDGFISELKASGWTDEQIATIEFSAPSNSNRTEAKQIFTDWINPKTVEEIADYHWLFAQDSQIAMGILEALSSSEIEPAKKEVFLSALTSFGSISGLDEVYQVLKGEHSNTEFAELVKNFDFFDVTYDPAMIKIAIQDMLKFLNGESVPKDHIIPASIVDATNVNQFQGY
ncbi:MAG: substrate-binding domain-containing protein [Bifidobacteriaceae bacterium]|jgi:ribose transport system substrate-binding protein|nr:substrate-binding domain-containing protein [Bifidobacteriaceae bacterium]